MRQSDKREHIGVSIPLYRSSPWRISGYVASISAERIMVAVEIYRFANG